MYYKGTTSQMHTEAASKQLVHVRLLCSFILYTHKQEKEDMKVPNILNIFERQYSNGTKSTRQWKKLDKIQVVVFLMNTKMT